MGDRLLFNCTPWTAACQSSLSFTVFQSLLKLLSVESVIPYKHLILCCPHLLLPSVFPSITVFSNESALCHIRWPKYWSFSFSNSPLSRYSGLISFRIDWFNLLAVQGNLKSLLQHHNLKASILRHSTFFIVHLSHLYMTTRKTVALTIQTFVGRMMPLLSIYCLAKAQLFREARITGHFPDLQGWCWMWYSRPLGLILGFIIADGLLDSRDQGTGPRTKGHHSDVLKFHLPRLNINFQPGVSFTKSSVLVNALGVPVSGGGNESSLLTVRIPTPSRHRDSRIPQCSWQ